MAELAFKELKSLLDENELDLSMRDISIIPTKSLRLLPRATQIDLSNNAIRVIELDFCSLLHLTKLDLSKNFIEQLPPNFGDLVNLSLLDLYKNKITDLPLSFGKLTALRWLDLKDNRLQADLATLANDCSDAKGCALAATRVVRLMQNRANNERQQRQQQQLPESSIVDDRTSQEQQSVLKEKAKKKKKKPKEAAISQTPTANAALLDEDEPNPFVSRIDRNSERDDATAARNPANRSLVSRLFAAACRIAMFAFALSTVLVVGNCLLGDRGQTLKASAPFCNDLHNALYHQSISSDIIGNFLASFKSIGELLEEMLSHFGHHSAECEKIAALKRYFSPVTDKLSSIALFLQGYFMHSFDDMHRWYRIHAADSLNHLISEAWLILRIVILMLADFVMFMAEKSLLFTSAAVDYVVDFAQHSDKLMRVLRNWWVTSN